MFKKLVLTLAVFALIAAAGTVSVGSHYTITLTQPAVVQGTVLKAGDYRITVKDNTLAILTEKGKPPVEVPVKLENGDQKFYETSVRLDTASGKAVISEIRLGGTKTTLRLN
jgi:hypothetical protein